MKKTYASQLVCTSYFPTVPNTVETGLYHSAQAVPDDPAGGFDILPGMGIRYKHRLKLGGRRINPMIQQISEIFCIPYGIRRYSALIIRHLLRSKKDAQKGADPVDAYGLPGSFPD